MKPQNAINPAAASMRGVLRVVGPLLAITGFGFIVFGMIDFFRAFGGSGPPQYFWCNFVGAPLLFIGVVLSKLAFMGAVFRYMAGETAPVAKDTFNYMAKESRPGVQDLAESVSRGWTAGHAPPKPRCRRCGHDNVAEARFCNRCGTALSET